MDIKEVFLFYGRGDKFARTKRRQYGDKSSQRLRFKMFSSNAGYLFLTIAFTGRVKNRQGSFL
jgi:hypothetical protein